MMERNPGPIDEAEAVRRFVHLSIDDLDAAERLGPLPMPPDTISALNAARGMVMALEAYALRLRGDTTGAIDRMREAIRTAGYSADALRPFLSGPLFTHAVTLSRQPDTRDEGIRRLRMYLFLGSGFTVFAHLALAEALEAEGDLAGAVEAYGHVLRLWERADPHLQPHVVHARQALARLTGEGRSR
jgi:hypothetical protein